MAFTNPDIAYLIENVCHHHELPHDLKRMSALWPTTQPMFLNANAYGSPSSRRRLIFTNIVADQGELSPRSRPSDPNKFLDDVTHFCPHGSLPCIVASSKTINPATIKHRVTGRLQYLSAAEMEAVQGLPTDATLGFEFTRDQRVRIIGNALNSWMMRAILVHYKYPTIRRATSVRYLQVFHSTLHTQPESYPATAKGADLFVDLLASFDDDCLRSYLLTRLHGYTPSQLMLHLKPGSGPRAKPKPFPVPSGLRDAVNYALNQAISKGYMEEIFHIDHDDWVSNMFVKVKKGRVWTGTDIPLVRPLMDLRSLNSCLMPSPAHWTFASPDQASMCQRIPSGTTHMISCDLSDAFHTAVVHPESRRLLVGQIAGRFIRYIGGPQGLAPMALFWNPHLHEGFYAGLSCHWIHLWTSFVDDCGVYGNSELAVIRRSRILSFLLDGLDKPHSFGGQKDGTWKSQPQTSMILAGIHVTPDGFSIADDQLEILRFTLNDYKVKTKEDAQHVIGVVQYCHSAFRMDSDTWKAYSTALYTLMDAANAAPSQKAKVVWGPSCIDACTYLTSLITNAPRAMWNPDTLLDDNHCLATMSDASDDAYSCCLFIVNCPNAHDVTEAMLKDRSYSQLLATKVVRLNDSQKRWATWEAEFCGIVQTVKSWGNYITTATSQYPKDPLGLTAKIVAFSDSTTSIAKWLTIHIPEGSLSCLNAKKRRFNDWATITAHTIFWPMTIKFMPGTNISLPHMLTHMADMLQSRQNLESQLPKMQYPIQIISTLYMFPARLVSYHENVVPTEPPHEIPSHFFIHLPKFTEADVREFQRAYLDDTTVYINGITIREIYCVLIGDNGHMPHPTVIKRIRSWQNTLFYAYRLHDIGILLTQISHQAIQHGTPDNPSLDQTNVLVLVAPANAKVTISSLEPICVDTAVSSALQIPVSVDTHRHPADRDSDEYLKDDFITDVMIFSHQGAHHASFLQSLHNLRSIIWFPGLYQRMQKFYDACSHCIPRAKALRAIGNSIRAARRFHTITVDHKVFDADIKEATKHAGALTISCNSCRVARFLPVRTLNASAAAMEFYTGWIDIFGVPAIIRSDLGSAFISDMMDAFRRMMGVKTWDHSCPDNPTHHSTNETLHRDFDNVLNVAANKGDLSSATLRFYCSVASQRHNQYLHNSNGFTPYQLMFGEPPRHQHNFMIIPTEQELEDLSLPPMDAKFIDCLKTSFRDTLLYLHFRNDARIQKDKAHKLTALYNQRCTEFDLRPDDIVSYDGKPATILELIQPTVTGPSKALIRITDHDSSTDKKVLYSDLLPIGIQYPELMIDPQHVDISPNVFCFFSEPTSAHTTNIVAGMIITTNDATQTCKIQRYEQSGRPKTKFIPMWTQRDGQLFARGKPQKHQIPAYATCSYKDIIVTTIFDNDRIPASVLRYLENHGVVPTSPT